MNEDLSKNDELFDCDDDYKKFNYRYYENHFGNHFRSMGHIVRDVKRRNFTPRLVDTTFRRDFPFIVEKYNL